MNYKEHAMWDAMRSPFQAKHNNNCMYIKVLSLSLLPGKEPDSLIECIWLFDI
jgi:hypothetical protein